MTAFRKLQADFARAVLDPAMPVPEHVTSGATARPANRFAVYRNNVIVSLVDALRARFPATEKIVGTEFFVGMSRAFIEMHPPESPLMMAFGDRLPRFIEGFSAAASVPYLADVAWIERARTKAYHAPNASTCDLSNLLSSEPERLYDARLELHPSLGVVRSQFPVVTIWEVNSQDDTYPADPDFRSGEDALITRPVLDVMVGRLPAGGARLLAKLQTSSFGESVNAAAEVPEFDLTSTLAFLIGSGAFNGFRMGEQVKE